MLDHIREGKLKSLNTINLAVGFELISSFNVKKKFSNTLMCKWCGI